jgi:predicted phosphoribosyltransferase
VIWPKAGSESARERGIARAVSRATDVLQERERAVGLRYQGFSQASDEDVRALLEERQTIGVLSSAAR